GRGHWNQSVSLILDALRRKSGRDAEHETAPTSRADAVMATLGYPRRSERRNPPVQKQVLYGLGALAIGFIAIAFPVLFLAPAPVPSPARVPIEPASTQAAAKPAVPPPPAPRPSPK